MITILVNKQTKIPKVNKIFIEITKNGTTFLLKLHRNFNQVEVFKHIAVNPGQFCLKSMCDVYYRQKTHHHHHFHH